LKDITKNIISEPYHDFEIVFKIQCLASVNIILEADAQISPFLPGKFAHCIKANRPILLIGPEFSECRRLLGTTYPYWAENKEVKVLTNLITQLYFQWKQNELGGLNREDLENYLSKKNLEDNIKQILG
jgi:hypothetical protein